MKEVLLIAGVALIFGCLSWTFFDWDEPADHAGDLMDQILVAAERGDVCAVRKLLALEQADKQQRARTEPLGAVILARRFDLIPVLLQAGADVNAAYGGGLTPLMLAASTDDVELIDLLLEHGATIDAQSHQGTTALMIAAESDHWPIVQRLLQAHADPWLRNAAEETALDIARAEIPRSRSTQLLTAAAPQKAVAAMPMGTDRLQ